MISDRVGGGIAMLIMAAILLLNFHIGHVYGVTRAWSRRARPAYQRDGGAWFDILKWGVLCAALVVGGWGMWFLLGR